jgi:hypothetical protein
MDLREIDLEVSEPNAKSWQISGMLELLILASDSERASRLDDLLFS